MLKPFKTIATAVAFSPNMAANICESIRIRQMLGEKLLLIHVGEHHQQEEDQIKEAIKGCGSDTGDVEIIWEEGDPVQSILKVSKERDVNLIVAGAEPREGLLRYYMGSVARRLVRQSDCSILLLTKPTNLKRVCGKVVVNGLQHPKTPDTIKTAVNVARQVGSRELVIVEEVSAKRIGTRVEDDESLQKASEAQHRIEHEEEERINKILSEVNTGDLRISQQCIFGKKGYSIGHFAESTCADLLVMNSPDTKLGFLDRVFTHDLEYILSELPSDLLIVHSKEA